MQYLKLAHSDLTVSRFCMGGCPMGVHVWGNTNEQNFIDTIHMPLEEGVNYFDTADTYGLGQSERTLAKGLGSRRKDVIIQSKFGVRAGNGKTFYDNSPAYIREALEQTLSRLQTDYLDVYVMHYWDGKTPPEEIAGELLRLQKEGKIRYFGLSNLAEDQIPLWRPYQDGAVNVQYEFSLACRKHEDQIAACREQLGVTPLTWGSLGQGILTGKYDEHSVFGADDRRSRDIYVNFHGEKLKKNLAIVEQLRKMANRYEVSVASCAIRFILDHLKDSVVIAGVKTPQQLKGNLEMIDRCLTDEEVRELDRISKDNE